MLWIQLCFDSCRVYRLMKISEIRLIDVDTEYLYGTLYTDIYIRVPDELKMPKALNLNLKIYVQQNCKDHYID